MTTTFADFADPPADDFDPYTAENHLNPWPQYARLQGKAPVVKLFLDGRTVYAITGYEHIRAAFERDELYSSRGGLSLHPREREQAGVLISTDGREHARLCRVISPYLTERAIGLRRRQVTAYVGDLVAELVERGSFDAVTDLARRVPVQVVSDLIGLPDDGERDRFADWAAAATYAQGPKWSATPQALDRIAEMRDYVGKLGVDRKFTPGGLGETVFGKVGDGLQDITSQEATSIVWGGLVVAGLHTTIAALGWLIWALATEGITFDERLAHARVADEVVRWQSPFPHVYRTTTHAVSVGDYLVPADARVLLLVGAGNRDGRWWQNPDMFDPFRVGVQDHLGLGRHVHSCLGQHLFRLEVEALLLGLLRAGVRRLQVTGRQREVGTTVGGCASRPTTVELG
jgi:cytochrome P450